MPRPTALDAARSFRASLANDEAQAAGRMATIYNRIYTGLQGDLAKLSVDIAAMDSPKREDILALARMQAIQQQVKDQVTKFGGTVQNEVTIVQSQAVQAGIDNALKLIETSLPPLPDDVRKQLVASFARLPADAVEAAAGLTGKDSPLNERLSDLYGEYVAEQVGNHITDGIAKGDNPRTIARQLEKNVLSGLGSGLTSALTTVRTAQIKSYQLANHATYLANDNIVKGWVWHAELGSACLGCTSLHGSIHPLDETLDGHHNCRCLIPGSMVMTSEGVKPIERIELGDYVLTHRGRYRMVLGVSARYHAGQVFEVTQDGQKVTATPEHPFLTNQGWAEAKDLRADMTLFILNDLSTRAFSLNTVQPSSDNRLSFFSSIGRFLLELCQPGSSSTASIWPGKAKSILNDSTANWGIGLNPASSSSVKKIISLELENVKQLYCLHSARLQADSWLAAPLRSLSRKLGSASLWRLDASLGEIGSMPLALIRRIKGRVLIPSSLVIWRYVAFSSTYLRVSQSLIGSPSLAVNSVSHLADSNRPWSVWDLNKPSFLARCLTLLAVRPGKRSAIWYASIFQNLKRIISSSLSVHFERIIKLFLYGNSIHRQELKVKRMFYNGLVYNLQVQDDESYIANGIVVHNCAPIPQTITYEELGLDIPETVEPVESGEDWFNQQPASTQRELMGGPMYDAWKAGKVEFGQLSKPYDDAVYGQLLREASLKDILGDDAKEFYK